MASKEAAKAEPKAAEPEFYAFEFNLPKDKIGEKTTNPQVKSKVGEAFLGYGAFTECQVVGQPGNDRTVIVFFARLFEKGQPTWNALKKNEKATVKVYDEDVELRLSGAKPSGGGATTGTSARPKKEAAKKAGGRGAPRGGDRKEGGAAAAGGDKKEGGDAKKEGERPKRPKRPQEEKKDSLQRGRANIGGKLGPVSKIRLARQAKEARDKENAARIARGEAPLEDEKKKGKDDDDEKPPAKAAGKKEAGKKEAGKKEAGKAEGKKEGAKKGK